MRAMMPQEFGGKQVPRIEDYTDLPDPFYNALPEDKKEAYKDAKLEEMRIRYQRKKVMPEKAATCCFTFH